VNPPKTAHPSSSREEVRAGFQVIGKPKGGNSQRPGPQSNGTGGLRRAVFFDRDGTLNQEVGYVNHPSRLQVYPRAGEAVRLVNEAGWLAIVVTNQSGVARGLFTEALVQKTHRTLARRIAEAGAWLDGIYYCPHHPLALHQSYRADCACRKPSPGMLLEAAARFGIDLKRSFVIGDRHLDMQMAHQVGATAVLVLTGYGRGEWEYQRSAWQRQPDHVARDVREAARWILRQP